MTSASPGVGPALAPSSVTCEAVLSTLVYYSLFRFPLTTTEIHRLTGQPTSLAVVETTIDELAARGLLGRQGEYAFLGQASDIVEREEAQGRARAFDPRILRRARLIGGFPFVRGVGLSGTVSKGILKPGDDVDFFVVTSPGRLWLCRTILMVFKRVALLNSHRLFCVNYLVSEERMTLPDRNVFTAMEVAWLRPVWGAGWYEEFLSANRWIGEFLPSWRPFEGRPGSERPGRVRLKLERALSGAWGDRAEARVRSMIEQRNRRKYRHLSPEDFAVAFRSEAHSSKHHPGNNQGRVMARYESALAGWLARLRAARSE